MKTIRHIFAWAMLAPALVFAESRIQLPNWDARFAEETARVPASQSRIDELFALLQAGDTTALYSRLDETVAGRSLTEPSRDYVLFRFAVGLADYPEADQQLLERLRAIAPRVLVPHPERESVGVPLFNIAGAAEGVRQLRLRRQAQSEAERSLGAPGEQWINAYMLASRSQRMGFGDALASADDETLSDILHAAVQGLERAPELTPIAGKSALLLGDASALQAVVRSGDDRELASVLGTAAETLTPAAALALLQSAIAEAPPANAALAIARLYPALANNALANELLLGLLGNTELGASAAMALAAGGPEVRAELQHIAQAGTGPASARARTALALESGHGGQNR